MRYSLQSLEKSQLLPLSFAIASSSALKLAHVRNDAGVILLLSFARPTGLEKSMLICFINHLLKCYKKVGSQGSGAGILVYVTDAVIRPRVVLHPTLFCCNIFLISPMSGACNCPVCLISCVKLCKGF